MGLPALNPGQEPEVPALPTKKSLRKIGGIFAWYLDTAAKRGRGLGTVSPSGFGRQPNVPFYAMPLSKRLMALRMPLTEAKLMLCSVPTPKMRRPPGTRSSIYATA